MLLDIEKLFWADIHMTGTGFDFRLAVYIAVIPVSVTIGKAIRGKYEDKAACGK